MSVHSAFPPERLLFLRQLAPAPEVAALMGQITAAALPRNPAFQRDVFRVWQHHAGDTAIDTVGKFRAFYAAEALTPRTEQVCPCADPVKVERMLKLFAEFSRHTTLSRSGDRFVRTCVASTLPVDVAAGLGVTETPYDAAAAVLEGDYNSYVGDLFKTALPERYARTQWKQSTAIVDGVFLFSLIFECLVTERHHSVALEHELAYAGARQVPTIAIVNNAICLWWHDVVWSLPDGCDYPLLNLAVLWVQLSAAANEAGCQVVNTCLFDPSALSSRDPIYSWVQRSIVRRPEDT